MSANKLNSPKDEEANSVRESDTLLSGPKADNNDKPIQQPSASEEKKKPGTGSVVIGIIAYSLCSSSLLLLNKFAVTNLPSVSFVLICQFLASIFVVKLCGALGLLKVDGLEYDKVRKFWGVSFLFACCLFTNVKALQYANVETLIVFRACTPLAVAIMDYFVMNMELPNLRSWFALISIVFGAMAYVYFDGNFKLDSYLWVMAYFVSIVTEMVYVKFVITEVDMTTWGRVYYNNVLSIPPTMLFGYAFNDHIALAQHEWTVASVVFLILSCVVGVGISYAGFYLRALISATSFTVVGVVNKLATTAVNALVWDKHADVYGISSLLLCILGGTLYQQAEKKRAG